MGQLTLGPVSLADDLARTTDPGQNEWIVEGAGFNQIDPTPEKSLQGVGENALSHAVSAILRRLQSGPGDRRQVPCFRDKAPCSLPVTPKKSSLFLAKQGTKEQLSGIIDLLGEVFGVLGRKTRKNPVLRH